MRRRRRAACPPRTDACRIAAVADAELRRGPSGRRSAPRARARRGARAWRWMRESSAKSEQCTIATRSAARAAGQRAWRGRSERRGRHLRGAHEVVSCALHARVASASATSARTGWPCRRSDCSRGLEHPHDLEPEAGVRARLAGRCGSRGRSPRARGRAARAPRSAARPCRRCGRSSGTRRSSRAALTSRPRS